MERKIVMLKKVAILGATGAVGRQMLECLIERNFPCEIKCSGQRPQRRQGNPVPGPEVHRRRSHQGQLRRHGHRARRGQRRSGPAHSPRTSRPRARCLWTIPARSAWRRTCRWWCRRSTPRTRSGITASSPTPTAPPSSPWWPLTPFSELSPIEAIGRFHVSGGFRRGRRAVWQSWKRRSTRLRRRARRLNIASVPATRSPST